MIISGVKHACAKCIRGHRSSTCNHPDRPLFEIRKKGRPVSQCPHCRDLRKIKSSHNKCECGAHPGDETGNGTCQCHSGASCTCAGQPQVFQYIPPDLSNASTVTGSTDTPSTPLGPATKSTTSSSNAPASMLHVFDLGKNLNTGGNNGIVTSNPMSTPAFAADFARSFSHSHHGSSGAQTPVEDPIAGFNFALPDAALFPSLPESPYQTQPNQYHVARGHGHHRSASGTPELSMRPSQKRTLSQLRDVNPSPTSRTIGVNTEALPAGIWPADPFEVPAWQQAQRNAEASACCPKVRDMPLKDLPFDAQNLAASTAYNHDEDEEDLHNVPAFSVFYGTGIHKDNDSPPDEHELLAAIDHATLPEGVRALEPDYDDAAAAMEFDPAFWDKLMEVPGCSIPGVQCKCGDGCSCAGCQTHTDNAPHVAAAELERMDVSTESNAKRPARQHPPGCCDTRDLHKRVKQHVAREASDEDTPADSSDGTHSCCSAK
ncbi:hypothetical protein PYCC9005_001260 [Savitreella phatthalungensis]